MKELDVVKLKDGREATILEVFDKGETFLVEVAGDDGSTQDLPIVKTQDIEKVIWNS